MRRLLPIALLLGAAPAPPAVDLLIRGGTVYPGGGAPFTGDIAVRGDRIVGVGRRLAVRARRVIDARGMAVAPGFIDPHTHMGDALASPDARTRLIPAFLLQGVTTAFIGNDGGGSLEVARVLAGAGSRPVGVNYAAYVGFGAVRQAVIGEVARAPDAGELARMRGLVARAMCEGALGLSTGLFYAPQSFATTDEVVALAREAGSRGGVYDSHLRDESSYTVGLLAAVREAGLPVHISHIKAPGVDVERRSAAVIALVRASRAAGSQVTADQYPWDASGTSLVAALVPGSAQDGGRAAMLRRFDDPALAARLRADTMENLRRRGGGKRDDEVGGDPAAVVRDDQRAAAGRDHRRPVTPQVRGDDRALRFGRRRELAAPGVRGDLQRSGPEGELDGEQRGDGEAAVGARQRHCDQRRGDAELREHDPPAPLPPEPR